MTGSMFCTCPYCGSDLRGEPFTPDGTLGPCPDGCGALDHWTRLTTTRTVMSRRTVIRFRCPDCGERWER